MLLLEQQGVITQLEEFLGKKKTDDMDDSAAGERNKVEEIKKTKRMW